MSVVAEISIFPIALSSDAQWLGIVEQRIKASIPAEGFPPTQDVAWLRPQVGLAALEFFRDTSTALPGEPYIYSSNAGDLVAEFSAPRGKMTCLISPEFVYVFAAPGNEVIADKLTPSKQGADELRSYMQTVTDRLRAANQDGTLEAKP
jgi:hypothetical protein